MGVEQTINIDTLIIVFVGTLVYLSAKYPTQDYIVIVTRKNWKNFWTIINLVILIAYL